MRIAYFMHKAWSSLGWVSAQVHRIQIFELGVSVTLYYLLIYYLLPVSVLLGFPLKYSLENYHINYLALGYLALGFIFFLWGYFNRFSVSLAGRLPNILEREWNFSRAPYVFFAFFVIGLAVKFLVVWGGAYSLRGQTSFLIKSSLYSAIGFLNWSGYIALALAFIVYFYLRKNGDRRYRMWCVFAWGAFVTEIAYAIPSCVRMNMVVPILIYLLIRSFLVRVDYRFVVLWGAAIVLFIFPLGNMCRAPQMMKLYGLVPEKGTLVSNLFLNDTQRSQVSNFLLSDTQTVEASKISNAPYFVAETFMGRLGQSVVFTAILEHPQPFWYGKPLLNFFVSLGPPRFIWKSKPVITANGNEFGRRIGVLAPDNTGTFVGPTFVGDWYMNFGVPGIIGGMFFIGFLFRLIFDYLVRRTGASLSGLLVYSIVWIQLMKGFEDSLAPVFAGLVKVVVFLFFIALFLQGDLGRIWHRFRGWIMMRV